MNGRRQGAWWLLLALALASAWAWWRDDQGLEPAAVWPASATPKAPTAFGQSTASLTAATVATGTVQPGVPVDSKAQAESLTVPAAEPAPVSVTFVTASLSALRAHGVRLDQAQTSLHTVQVVDIAAARQVRRWAAEQGFVTPPLVKIFEHGGEVNWVVPIERHGLLQVERIVADALAIQRQAAQFTGARYHSWQVPLGERATISRSGGSPGR